MAYNIRQGLGWDTNANATSGQTLNNANNWNASGIRGFGVALNNFRHYISAKTGTVPAASITAELYSADTTTGKPSASIEGPISCDADITAAGFYQWSGFTTTLTAGVQYYIVIKNADATPASNYVVVSVVREQIMPSNMGTSTTSGMNRYTSTDAGTTWSNSFSGVAGPRFDFAGGIYRGLALSDIGAGGATYGVYADREAGAKFTTPLNTRLRVIGLWIQASSLSGTPTGSARIGLYVGSDSVVYTDVIPNAAFGVGVILYARLSTAKEIPPGTVCRVVLGETTQSDASTDRFNIQIATVENSAVSKGLLPFGAFPATYWNGSAWTDTDTASCPCGIILDDAGEFASSGGGILNHPGLSFGSL